MLLAHAADHLADRGVLVLVHPILNFPKELDVVRQNRHTLEILSLAGDSGLHEWAEFIPARHSGFVLLGTPNSIQVPEMGRLQCLGKALVLTCTRALQI